MVIGRPTLNVKGRNMRAIKYCILSSKFLATQTINEDMSLKKKLLTLPLSDTGTKARAAYIHYIIP